MLNVIRDNVQSFGVKLIVGIIAVVMLTFGLSSFNERDRNTLVEVDDYQVKLEDYSRLYEQAQAQYRNAYKDQAEQYMKAANLKGSVLQQLINNAVLLKNAEANGIKVSDLELANAIYENPGFQTDNRFDQKKYNQYLKRTRSNKIAYERDLRDELLTQKYIRFLNTGVAYSRKYVEDEYKRFNTKMDISVLEIRPELFAKQVKVSDEQIKAYYEANKKNFEQKKQLEISYILFNRDDEMDSVKIRDKEVRKYYDRNLATEFTTNDSFNSSHILIPHSGGQDPEQDEKALKQAQWIYEQLKVDKTKFAKFAAAFSSDSASKVKGGNLGWVEKGSFVKEYEAAIDTLKKGEISQPFRTQFGYHIVELIDTKPAEVKPFDSVKDEIILKKKEGKAKRRLDNKVARLLTVEEGASPKNLKQLAEETGKKIVETKAFDDSKELDIIGYTYNIYNEINKKVLGDTGAFTLPDEKGEIIYEIKKVIDPFIKPLEEVKEQARAMAQRAELRKYAYQKADDYAGSIQNEDQFDKLISELGAKPKDYQFRLIDNNRELGNMDFKLEIFKIPVGGFKVLDRNGLKLLVHLKAKDEVTNEIGEGEIAALGKQLQQQKVRNILTGIILNTRSKLEIKTNQPMLNALQIQL